MGLAYVGSFDFQETAEFTLTTDKFGLGSLQRTFKGKTDLLTSFLAKWPANKADATFKQYKFVSAQAQGGGAYTTVTLSFAGLLNGELPKPKKSGGWSTQTISLKKFDSQETAEFEYRAPTATYMYVSKTMPEKLQYEGKLLTPAVSWEITGRKGDRRTRLHECTKTGERGGVVFYTPPKTLEFNFARDVTLSDFDFNQVGDYWEVVESYSGILIEPSESDMRRFLTPDQYSQLPG